MDYKKKICGLILTAGYSSRMGAFKPLLPIGDMSAIEQVISALKRAGVERIVAVTGFNQELLQPVLQKNGVNSVYNERFSEGMFTSIQAGIGQALAKAPFDIEGFLLMLVDSPLIPARVIDLIIERHQKDPDAFIVPCYKGKKGHPLFIPACYSAEIQSYEGDGGLKAITNRYEHKLIRLEVGEEAVVLDMDTPEGYDEILEFYERQACSSASGSDDEDWKKLLGQKKLYLVRHGQIEQHAEKIFLGQNDIPLSDLGRLQAHGAGLKLKGLGVNVGRIYTSDLSRAAATAEIIAEVLNPADGDGKVTERIPIISDSSLREMALGEWDGQFISRIKERYPEEYKKRGENLLTFKYGHDSENFYDLQYRVIKGLRRILQEEKALKSDESEALIIVAHAGVIKVILSNLYHRDLSEEIKQSIPNGAIVSIEF